jgi:transcription elongation factor GreA
LSLYTLNSIPHDAVGYGSLVTLENDDGAEEKYQIVFPEEVDAAAGLISIGSPLGRALLTREVGDEVEVATPKGRRKFQIVELQTYHERNDQKVS